ncbi:hypothetical protein PIB30_114021, partial [Stylosanthes scabra]|nr:hypothetical protein [Stylosanthes scabra]
SEETRLELTQPKTDLAFAATDKQSNYCRHCHQTGHILPQCPTVSCHACKKIGHIASHCPDRRSRSTSYKQRPQPSKPVFAAINESAATSSNTTALSDVESLLKKILLSSGNTNTALSTTSGNHAWYFDSGCSHHMTSNSQPLFIYVLHCFYISYPYC